MEQSIGSRSTKQAKASQRANTKCTKQKADFTGKRSRANSGRGSCTHSTSKEPSSHQAKGPRGGESRGIGRQAFPSEPPATPHSSDTAPVRADDRGKGSQVKSALRVAAQLSSKGKSRTRRRVSSGKGSRARSTSEDPQRASGRHCAESRSIGCHAFQCEPSVMPDLTSFGPFRGKDRGKGSQVKLTLKGPTQSSSRDGNADEDRGHDIAKVYTGAGRPTS